MRSTRTRGKKSTPHRDPDDRPRRRANKQRGHGTYDNDRPPIIHIISRDSGEERCWVVGHSDKATCQGILAEAVVRDGTIVYSDEYRSYHGLELAHARSIMESTNGHVMTMATVCARSTAIAAKGRVPHCARSCARFAACIKPTSICTSRPMRRWSMPARLTRLDLSDVLASETDAACLLDMSPIWDPCPISVRGCLFSGKVHHCCTPTGHEPEMKRLLRTLFSRKENLALAIIAGLALLKLLIHVLTSSTYGYFRDELYYIAASQHLAFGYVDFPPFIALLTAFIRFTLGDSLLALHFFPALAGAGVIVLTALMARQLGADLFGQVLAALAVLVAPVYLGTNALLTMDSFDMLVWAAGLYVLILILKEDRPKLWLLFGLLMGIGLTIKVTPLYFGLALLIALALTPYRKYFSNLYLYLGGLIALAFLLPYVIWNAANGWPTLEFWRNYGNKVYQASPPVFLLQQIAIMHPISLPLWLSGLVFLFTQRGKQYRLFGWMYLTLFVIFMLQHAKDYFLAPFYPLLFASGTIAMQQFASSRGWHWLGWLRTNYIPFLVIGGMLLTPLTIPMLPLNALVPFVRVMGGTNIKSENADSGILPQNFADRFGWEELAVTMSDVYHSLPAQDRAKACIFTSNYGEAGALQFYRSKYDLPPVISGHNTYYLWGPGSCTGAVLIYLGRTNRDDLKQGFADVQQVAVTKCQYCMPYENDLPIFLCRGLKVPIEQAWPQTKFIQ